MSGRPAHGPERWVPGLHTLREYRRAWLVSEATSPVRWVVVAAEPITDIDTSWVDWEERLPR
jgi:hypothetical protein